jgi:hypothetical protein
MPLISFDSSLLRISMDGMMSIAAAIRARPVETLLAWAGAPVGWTLIVAAAFIERRLGLRR